MSGKCAKLHLLQKQNEKIFKHYTFKKS